MKKLFLTTLALSITLTIVSCKDNNAKTADQQNTETSITENNATNPETTGHIITSNEGKYPRDINFFENKEFSNRTKALLGDQYDEMIENFNVETPIVSEDGIYKFTGCKQNSCPAYQTTFLYDAKNDNLNVVISQNGEVEKHNEKGEINLTESLSKK